MEIMVKVLILGKCVIVSFADLKRCELKSEDDKSKGDYFQLQVVAFFLPNFFFFFGYFGLFYFI